VAAAKAAGAGSLNVMASALFLPIANRSSSKRRRCAYQPSITGRKPPRRVDLPDTVRVMSNSGEMSWPNNSSLCSVARNLRICRFSSPPNSNSSSTSKRRRQSDSPCLNPCCSERTRSSNEKAGNACRFESSPLWGVCHERAVCLERCGTVREMKEGPSRPAVRCRSQATASCCRQERWWCCVKKVRERHAVREMKEDPSEPSCRGRLQTAMSCFGQKLR
jgi:hypothetical protein